MPGMFQSVSTPNPNKNNPDPTDDDLRAESAWWHAEHAASAEAFEKRERDDRDFNAR